MSWVFDDNMVDKWVTILPYYCHVCGGRCYRVKDYKYACRCADCSYYYHIELLSCKCFEVLGYSCSFCCLACHNRALNVYELKNGELAEVCGGCAEWLDDMEFINSEPLHTCRIIRQTVQTHIGFNHASGRCFNFTDKT